MKISNKDKTIFVLGIIGILLFLGLKNRMFPETALGPLLDQTEILSRSLRVIQHLGYSADDLKPAISLDHDNQMLHFLGEKFGTHQANRFIRDSISVYKWNVLFSRTGKTSMSGSAVSYEDMPASDQFSYRLSLTMDLQGRLLSFEYQDTVKNNISFEQSSEDQDKMEAESLARSLFTNFHGSWDFDGVKERETFSGLMREYTWSRLEPVADIDISLVIEAVNSRITGFRHIFLIPESDSLLQKPPEWLTVIPVGIYIIIIILLFVQFISRLRADIIDLKSGILPAFIMLAGWWPYLAFQIMGAGRENIVTELVINMGITGLVLFGLTWVLYCTIESFARAEWPEKLMAWDAFRRKMIIPESGLAVLRGMAIAGVIVGLYTFSGFLINMLSPLHVSLSDDFLRLIVYRGAGLNIFFYSLFNTVFIIGFSVVFSGIWVKRRFQSSLWIILIIAIVCITTGVSMSMGRFMPHNPGLVSQMAIGLMLGFALLKFDFFTVFAASLTIPLIYYAGMSCSAGGIALLNFGIFFILLSFLFVLGIAGLRSRTSSESVQNIVPEYMNRIYERERIHRELEIAGRVQQNFLPGETPRIKGLDIASICIPAREVGGDYFDFIKISDNLLAIVISDVSGKGVSAAFYMTLIKGFLKAQTRIYTSPREILINMNELFYENAERGMFVSMILGVFDLSEKTLTFSRAGHNPMILRRSEKKIAEELELPGLALGLEKGEIFSRVIEERIIHFSQGDVLLFYTDGLSEAQNNSKEEFGEERLMYAIESYPELGAKEQLEQIYQQIVQFCGDVPQHDDLTAILIKAV